MDRVNYNFRPHPSIVIGVAFGEDDSLPFDQQGVQKFNIDPATGCPLSDITAILRSKDNLDGQRLLASFEQYKSEFLPEDISDEDALKYYQPARCQMPSELAELQERILRERIEEEAKQKEFENEQEYEKYVEERLAAIRAKSKSDSESKSE